MRYLPTAAALAGLLTSAVLVPSGVSSAEPGRPDTGSEGRAGSAPTAGDTTHRRPTPRLAVRYRDVVDRTGSPRAFREFDRVGNQVFNPLLDQGAWHGFTLPAEPDEYGGFTGPMVISEEYSLFFAHELDQLSVRADGRPVDLAAARSHEVFAIPGALVQRYDLDRFAIELELRYADSRTAVIRTRVTNHTRSRQRLELAWRGALSDRWDPPTTLAEKYPDWTRSVTGTDTGVRFTFGRLRS
uniref:hypothetical protein n=1 Tax=Intrasporangium sp. TaxID=1925024 RepID=UPI0032216CC1